MGKRFIEASASNYPFDTLKLLFCSNGYTEDPNNTKKTKIGDISDFSEALKEIAYNFDSRYSEQAKNIYAHYIENWLYFYMEIERDVLSA